MFPHITTVTVTQVCRADDYLNLNQQLVGLLRANTPARSFTVIVSRERAQPDI